MATDVSICNSALIKLGAERISSLSDISKEAILCNEQYEKILTDLLYSHPWNFATKSAIWQSNGNLHPWTEMEEFDLPDDYLRVLDFKSPYIEWAMENGKLYANEAELYIRYIFYQDDPEAFSVKFVELFAVKLALELSYSLVQSASLKDSIQREYEQCLRDARSFDSQEGKPGRVDNGAWLQVRL